MNSKTRLVFLAILCSFAGLPGAYGQLALHVSPANYETFITNASSSIVDFDGYSIQSTAGLLDPAGWSSLETQGGFGFEEVANITVSGLAEIRATGAFSVAPGQQINLGFPLGVNGEAVPVLGGDAVFQYVGPGIGVVTGPINLVPEPASLTLACSVLLVVFGGSCHRRR